MDVSEILVRHSSAVHGRRNIHVAGKELRTAPTASAASAIGRRIEPSVFHRAEKRGVRVTGDNGSFSRNMNGQVEFRAYVARIVFVLLGVEEFAEEFVTNEFLTNAELLDFFIRKIVHRLRTAHKDRKIAVRRVLFDEIRRNKSAFRSFLYFVRKNVYEFDLIVRFRPLRDLVRENGVGEGATAVKQSQGALFVSFRDRFRKGAEGSDPAAARDPDHGIRVAQSFVSKVAKRRRRRYFIPDFPMVENILRNDAAAHSFDRQHIEPGKSVRGGRGDGVGTLKDLSLNIAADRKILSGGEEGEFFRSEFLVRSKVKALHIGGELFDLFDYEVLNVRMQFRGEFVRSVRIKIASGSSGRTVDRADPVRNNSGEGNAAQRFDFGFTHLTCPP